MTRSDQIIIKLEFDRAIKYLMEREDKLLLTTADCIQELGALRLFIFELGTEKLNHKP